MSVVTEPVTMEQSDTSEAAAAEQAMLTLEHEGMTHRKPCNCKKSKCLMLYCDCFSNGEFCSQCNCRDCFNNLAHEEERQQTVKLILKRNPGAFRPKIRNRSQTGETYERRNNKGCNCRRSGCRKKYCECYGAKISCSDICKCAGCQNCIENIPTEITEGVGVEQHFTGAGTYFHRQALKDLAEGSEIRVQQQDQLENKMEAQWQYVSTQNNIGSKVPAVVLGYPSGRMSYKVIRSTVDLLLAKASAGELLELSEGEQERVLIEEFGECLSALMEHGTSPTSETQDDEDE